MRWILCGKNDVAVHALELLLERGDSVHVLGSARDDGRDGWQRSLRAAAGRLGAPFEQPRRINDPACAGRLAAFGATALLSIQYDQILRGPLFRALGCPCLNFHFSLLPRHRGVAPIAWAILSGDAEAGVTLHHMLEDVDAGDVIAQARVPVRPDDTARELYDRVVQAACALFRTSYPFGRELLETRLAQDPALASYHAAGELDFSQCEVDWNRPAAELHAWLRAWIFPPLQRPETSLAGRRFAVDRVAGALGGAVEAAPGTVVARGPEGIDVATADRVLRITRLLEPGRPGAPPDALPDGLASGDRLGPRASAARRR